MTRLVCRAGAQRVVDGCGAKGNLEVGCGLHGFVEEKKQADGIAAARYRDKNARWALEREEKLADRQSRR
ncbi:hypothetical protein GGQ65_002828 [Rhizobium fabae]|uniref:Uncharacterized protein n=1 Tax=Rhizobium fabae TaxID=573179 RepID=A0A7W6B7U2_9HYPH|nr:hypothetical protein [Rhizobium fabae]